MYKLNDERMFCDISDNTAIIIDSQVGTYYGMNYFSTEILQSITNGVKLETIIDQLQKIPNCPENITQNLELFVSELVNKNIIIEDNSLSYENHTFSNDVAIADNFKLVVDEFEDFKEIIFADVIINDLESLSN